jgi:Lrp/AsnC family transcriptional regulator for asnA, asnC and gidA
MELDQTDLAIIEQLRLDGRRTNVDLAEQVGVTEATVRRRLQRLMDNDLVQVVVVSNPRRLGYTIDAAVQIRARGDRVLQIGQQLAALPEVRMVACTTGPFDIEVVGMFRSQEELFDFVTRKVAGIEGVESTSTVLYLKVLKRTADRGAMDNGRRGDALRRRR